MVHNAVKLWPFADSQIPMDCFKVLRYLAHLVWTRSEYQGPAEISMFQHSAETYASGVLRGSLRSRSSLITAGISA